MWRLRLGGAYERPRSPIPESAELPARSLAQRAFRSFRRRRPGASIRAAWMTSIDVPHGGRLQAMMRGEAGGSPVNARLFFPRFRKLGLDVPTSTRLVLDRNLQSGIVNSELAQSGGRNETSAWASGGGCCDRAAGRNNRMPHLRCAASVMAPGGGATPWSPRFDSDCCPCACPSLPIRRRGRSGPDSTFLWFDRPS